MREEHGDCVVMDQTDGTFAVSLWGVRWWCKTIDDARKVAELLTRVAAVAIDCASEE
jgi:hypothetical protein